MMKDFFQCSLSPLQNRTGSNLPKEQTSFQKAWGAICPILLYYLVNQLVYGLSAGLLKWISAKEGAFGEGMQGLQYSALALVLCKGSALLCGAIAVLPYFREEAPTLWLQKKYKKELGGLFILGAGLALSLNLLFSYLQLPQNSAAYEQVAKEQFALPLGLGILLYGVVSPLAEEIVFRGIVYNRLRRQYNRTAAFIVSSLLFGCYHGNIVQMLYATLLGFVIAVLYEKYGAFSVPFLLHAAANSVVYLVSSVPVLQKYSMHGSVLLVSGGVSLVLLFRCLRKQAA